MLKLSQDVAEPPSGDLASTNSSAAHWRLVQLLSVSGYFQHDFPLMAILYGIRYTACAQVFRYRSTEEITDVGEAQNCR